MELNELLHESPVLLKYEHELLKLVSNFGGIEDVVEDPSELPSEAITAILRQCLIAPPEKQARSLCSKIARLSLFEYHAVSAKGDIWNPLSESLQDFRARHRRKGKITLWRDWGQYPTAAEVEQWLDRWLEF